MTGVQARGGPEVSCHDRRSAGFTLVELLVVTLILGILLAIMLPRLDQVRDRAHFATIGSDLRNMGSSQERYLYVHRTYSPDPALMDFSPSSGVNLQVTEATASGWAAIAWHDALGPDRGCSVYLGNAGAPPLPGGEPHTAGPGSVQCTR